MTFTIRFFRRYKPECSVWTHGDWPYLYRDTIRGAPRWCCGLWVWGMTVTSESK